MLFWMLIAFGVVFLLLAKYGFPVIMKAIDSRKEFIDSSIGAAHEAQKKMASVEADSRKLVEEAQAERTKILREAVVERERVIAKAKQEAETEGQRLVAEAKKKAITESNDILRDAQQQVAILAVAISEKLLREQLKDDHAQIDLAKKLFEEMKPNQQL